MCVLDPDDAGGKRKKERSVCKYFQDIMPKRELGGK